MTTKKRHREEPTAAEAAEGEAENVGLSNNGTSRRKDMASIARRRAAHFAHFNDDDDTGENNVHVGNDQARTLGPWSSAMELVNAREKAQHDRQAKLQGAKDGAQEAPEDKEVAEWQPSRDPSLGPHPRTPVRPLFDICLDVLTAYVDCVESLWGVPDVIKVRLAASVCARRKMSAEVSRRFIEDAPSEVLLTDCTQLDAAAMGDLIRRVATTKLERLELGFCGRGFGDEAAALLASAGPLQQLDVVALEGAYRLSDGGLEKVLSVAPSLTWLAVPQGSRVTGALLDKLPGLVPRISHLNLADCRGVGADSLVAALPRLTALRTLKLDFIPEVDDAVLTAAGLLPQLRELSIRCCQAVTDSGLTALAATRGSVLEVLRLDECGGKVTDRGIEALASQCKALRVFSARRCTRLGDLALAELLRAGTMRHLTLSGVTGVGPAVAGTLASCCHDTLEYLDVSFCRKLPDRSMGPLLDRCSRLRRLVVFGCSQLTPRSLYGNHNADLVIDGLHTKVGLDLAAAVAGGASPEALEPDGAGKDEATATGLNAEDEASPAAAAAAAGKGSAKEASLSPKPAKKRQPAKRRKKAAEPAPPEMNADKDREVEVEIF